MRHISELAPQTQPIIIINQILSHLTLMAQMIAISLERPGKMWFILVIAVICII